MDIISKFADEKITDTECNLELKAYMTGKDTESLKGAAADLDAVISEYLDKNPAIVEDYRKNEKAANRVIGFVMKQTGGAYSSADVVTAATRLLKERL